MDVTVHKIKEEKKLLAHKRVNKHTNRSEHIDAVIQATFTKPRFETDVGIHSHVYYTYCS